MSSHLNGVLFNCMPTVPLNHDEIIILGALQKAGYGFAANVNEIIDAMPSTWVSERATRRYLHSLIRKGYVWGVASEADDEDDLYVPCRVRGMALKAMVEGVQ